MKCGPSQCLRSPFKKFTPITAKIEKHTKTTANTLMTSGIESNTALTIFLRPGKRLITRNGLNALNERIDFNAFMNPLDQINLTNL